MSSARKERLNNMPQTVKADNLAAAVNDLLKEYGDEAKEIAENTITSVAKEAAKNVKANATGFGGTGKYAKGWKAKIEKKRLYIEAHVYNAALPGLAHLLEHGHAQQNGGRTKAYEHIGPINDRTQDDVMAELERNLSK